MADETAIENEIQRDTHPKALHLTCAALILGTLAMDLCIPLGVVVGVLYIAAVLVSLWSPRARVTVLVAALSSALIVGALLYKPVVPATWKAVFNRGISLCAVWTTALLGLRLKKAERKREQAVRDSRILRGLLPICASCKKIRDDKGYWTQIEKYIGAHSEADFTHGICPECSISLYPELFDKHEGDEVKP